MISKSLSRNKKSFEALYNYLTRDKESILNTFNLYADPRDREAVIKEFMENSEYLNRARGKNYLYHEILSLPQNDLSLERQKQILNELSQKYLSLRAENHLAFSSLHHDKEHTHMHLMISANEFLGNKRVRLSKKEFGMIQKELEVYKNEFYPELMQTKHYQKAKDFSKSRNKEQELKKRTKRQTKREILKEKLQTLFSRASSKEELEKLLSENEMNLYKRGRTTGVKFEGKSYRFKTLGVLKEYETCIDRGQSQKKKQRAYEQENDKMQNPKRARDSSNKEDFTKQR